MASEHVDRRLAAILAADVAGYSRLTSAAEADTHVRLKKHLRVLIDPKISDYRGRVVKNTSDGMLAEFSSVVDAVRNHHRALAPSRAIRHRLQLKLHLQGPSCRRKTRLLVASAMCSKVA